MSSIDENMKQVRPTLHMMEKTEFSPRIAAGERVLPCLNCPTCLISPSHCNKASNRNGTVHIHRQPDDLALENPQKSQLNE